MYLRRSNENEEVYICYMVMVYKWFPYSKGRADVVYFNFSSMAVSTLMESELNYSIQIPALHHNE